MVNDIVVPRNSGQLDTIKFIHAKVGETLNLFQSFSAVAFSKALDWSFSKDFGLHRLHLFQGDGPPFPRPLLLPFQRKCCAGLLIDWTTSPSSPAQLQQRSPMCLAFGC